MEESVFHVEWNIDLKFGEIPSKNELVWKFEVIAVLEDIHIFKGKIHPKIIVWSNKIRKKKEKVSVKNNIQKKKRIF